jgi:TolB protein
MSTAEIDGARAGFRSRIGRSMRHGWLIASLAAGLAFAAAPAGATFPGENGRIAYVRSGHVMTMSADGSHRAQRTKGGGNSDPAFSPSGRRIVYAHKVGKRQVIAVMNADGNHKRQVTKGHLDADPTFAPNGRRIAFSRLLRTNGFRHSEIFTTRLDGSHLSQVTGKRRDFDQRRDQPAFAHDGKTIVYEWFAGEDAGLARVTVGGKRLASHFPDGALEPSFAPDGKHVIFNDWLFTDPPQVGIADPDGGNAHELTANTDHGFIYTLPSYSPDGTKIVFASHSDIYVMSSDGTGAVKLTSDGRSSAPDWGPRPTP